MRVYEVEIEWRDGNEWKVWSNRTLLAKNFDEALAKAKRLLKPKQRILQCKYLVEAE